MSSILGLFPLAGVEETAFGGKRKEAGMGPKVKNLISALSVKQIVFSLITVLSLAIFLVLTIWSDHLVGSLTDQQAAMRWDDEGKSAQVSCFLSDGVTLDEGMVINFEKQLEQQLKEVLSSEEYSEENGRRLIVDAYSSQGQIAITSEKGSLEAAAVGVGGDFFYFHPLTLVSGRYLSGDDLMKDYIMLDEEAAWQLFGSSDIAGQSVMIGGIPHYVSGVVKRQDGRFARKAGLDKTVVYLSNESLAAYGKGGNINTYEVLAPNPVKHFVYTAVKEKLGIAEEDMEVVENSSRYSLESLIPVILDFGTRSMQNSAIKFPYWENIGRGAEDVKALALLFQGIFLLVPAVIILVFLVIKWKNRNFTWRDIGNYLVDAKDKAMQHARDKKDKWKHF